MGRWITSKGHNTSGFGSHIFHVYILSVNGQERETHECDFHEI